MTAPDIIAQLVERFDRNRDDYRSDRYNETQLRRYAWSAKLLLSINSRRSFTQRNSMCIERFLEHG